MRLRLVKLFYDITYSEARQKAGMRLSASEQERLTNLRELLGDDPGWRRRHHRRLRLDLPAVLRNGTERAVTVLEMSAGGALLACTSVPPPETDVQLKISAEGQAQYVFAGKVKRIVSDGEGCRVALAFEGIPLELRLHRSPPPPLSALFAAAS